MKTILTIVVLGILIGAALVNAETNIVTQVATNKADFERLMKMNDARAERGEAPIGFQLTPELDKQLTADGTFPPFDGADVLVTFNFKNAPLPIVAEEYAKYSGKTVVVDKNVSAAVSIATDEPVRKAQVALLIEKALAGEGLTFVSTGTNAVKITRQCRDK